MTLIFDKAQKELLQIQIASYMNDPKDAMNLTVQFSKLPNGPNHVSSMVIDGVSKQLNVATQNSNYQHLEFRFALAEQKSPHMRYQPFNAHPGQTASGGAVLVCLPTSVVPDRVCWRVDHLLLCSVRNSPLS